MIAYTFVLIFLISPAMATSKAITEVLNSPWGKELPVTRKIHIVVTEDEYVTVFRTLKGKAPEESFSECEVAIQLYKRLCALVPSMEISYIGLGTCNLGLVKECPSVVHHFNVPPIQIDAIPFLGKIVTLEEMKCEPTRHRKKTFPEMTMLTMKGNLDIHCIANYPKLRQLTIYWPQNIDLLDFDRWNYEVNEIKSLITLRFLNGAMDKENLEKLLKVTNVKHLLMICMGNAAEVMDFMVDPSNKFEWVTLIFAAVNEETLDKTTISDEPMQLKTLHDPKATGGDAGVVRGADKMGKNEVAKYLANLAKERGDNNSFGDFIERLKDSVCFARGADAAVDNKNLPLWILTKEKYDGIPTLTFERRRKWWRIFDKKK